MNLRLRRLLPFALLSLAVLGHAQTPPSANVSAEPSLAAYGDIGYALGQSGKFARLNWTEAQFEAFLSGLRDAFHRKAREMDPAAQALNDRTNQRLEEVEKEDTQAYSKHLKDPANLEGYMKGMCSRMRLERSDSGLAFGIQNMSGSVRPQPEDTVVVTWVVNTPDMKSEFQQLGAHKAKVKVSQLLPGLAEGVQMMTPNSAAMLVLPPDLSFGSGEWPPGVERDIPLVFMVKLDQVLPAQ